MSQASEAIDRLGQDSQQTKRSDYQIKTTAIDVPKKISVRHQAAALDSSTEDLAFDNPAR